MKMRKKTPTNSEEQQLNVFYADILITRLLPNHNLIICPYVSASTLCFFMYIVMHHRQNSWSQSNKRQTHHTCACCASIVDSYN